MPRSRRREAKRYRGPRSFEKHSGQEGMIGIRSNHVRVGYHQTFVVTRVPKGTFTPNLVPEDKGIDDMKD